MSILSMPQRLFSTVSTGLPPITRYIYLTFLYVLIQIDCWLSYMQTAFALFFFQINNVVKLRWPSSPFFHCKLLVANFLIYFWMCNARAVDTGRSMLNVKQYRQEKEKTSVHIYCKFFSPIFNINFERFIPLFHTVNAHSKNNSIFYYRWTNHHHTPHQNLSCWVN